MKKFLFYLMALPSVFLYVACGDDNDDSNNSGNNTITVNLTAANFTEDGYFDGTLYYKITSNSPQEVTVSKARKNAVVVEIPSIVNIDGSNYKCTSTSDCAFEGCSSLIEVTIPNSVISLAYDSFRHCTSLVSITIPNSVNSIGSDAFYNCSALTDVIIGNGVKTIGSGAFEGCSSLTNVTLGSSVEKINQSAFHGCYKLTTLYSLNPTPPSLYYSPFDGDLYKTLRVYVPQESLVAYLHANGWKEFWYMQGI